MRYACLLCVPFILLACKDDPGDSDASVPDGGTADVGNGSDGGRDDGGADLKGVGCFPDCLVKLFAPCWPTGECTSRIGQLQLRCFSDGTTVSTVGMDPRLPTNGYAEVFRTPKALCYSMDFAMRAGLKVFSYRSRDDVRIAEITFDGDEATTGTVRCIVDGGDKDYTARIDLTSPACQDSKTGIGGGTPAIPPPTCPESPMCMEP